jgi:signal transduction histidine kinase
MESMSQGGTLRISTQEGDNFVQIDISDTGIGFGPEVGEKVFTPFFTTKTRGSGLGLSVSRLVVELHGGRLKIASEKGKGTVVSIVLPAPTD